MNMRTWKRGGTLLAALALTLGLLGCGSSTPSGVQQPSPEQQTPPPAVEEPEAAAEPEPEPEPEPEKPLEGLIIATREEHIYQSGNAIECLVFCFNPDTKEETLIADFTYSHQDSSGNKYYDGASGYVAARSCFSSDYTKMSSIKLFASNNEQHVGWRNADGSFTDVTETLGQQSKSDFEGPVYYNSVGFAGENFGYVKADNSLTYAGDVFYLPVDHLSPDAIQEGNVHKVGHPYNEKGALMLDKYGYGKYGPEKVTDWIDDTHAIVNAVELSNRNSLIVDVSAQTETAYIPGDSRNNWNGVVSPDGTEIAFMSEPKSGSDAHADIYIIPVEGGDPVKVEGHSFDLEEKATRICALIDWI